ncbi:MAG TPA: ABC transporter substrate-binding protein, partial [Candidatus Limnocylindria bacterium]|nr:ABC transporter substrate-binding protein [Candidatus Limnocylindria bacterium]
MTNRRTGMGSLLVLLAIASLIVGACTAAPSGEGTTTGTTAGQADPNGVLTLNMGSEPDTIDPQKASFVNEIGQASFVFEGLMTFDTATSKAIPGAAAAAPTLSSDGLKYTFTLRDGLKYSDGSALTAKNFEYGFLRGCDPAAAGDYAFVLYIIAGCEAYNHVDTKAATPAELAAARAKVGVKATGDKTIEFTLTDPAPYFVPITALWQGWPVRESDVTKGGDKWTEPATYI